MMVSMCFLTSGERSRGLFHTLFGQYINLLRRIASDSDGDESVIESEGIVRKRQRRSGRMENIRNRDRFECLSMKEKSESISIVKFAIRSDMTGNVTTPIRLFIISYLC